MGLVGFDEANNFVISSILLLFVFILSPFDWRLALDVSNR
jgi:hypothetical protein